MEFTILKNCEGSKGRKIRKSRDELNLREEQTPYNGDFTTEKSGLRVNNSYFWSINLYITERLRGPTPYYIP